MTLQISVAPTDVRHVRHVLPHQLRQWGGQVDEILVTVDLRRGAGRLQRPWAAEPDLRNVLSDIGAGSAFTVDDVDYSSDAMARVSAEFFGGVEIPAKDFRGRPVYAYFYGLNRAASRYVLHLDSDMLFGGGSQTWLSEAIAVLESHPDILVCGPLPGPPTASGELLTQTAKPEPLDSLAYRFEHFTARHFVLDRMRFADTIKALTITRLPARTALRARLHGAPPLETGEEMVSAAMRRSSLYRVNFLGAEPGMWSLHPPYRSEIFYASLPKLIDDVERNNVPDAQRGDYDVNDSMIDWTTARSRRERLRRRIRARTRLKNVLRSVGDRSARKA